MPRASRSRNFIITLNNPTRTLEEYGQLATNSNLRYTMQMERGQSGTIHLQAFLTRSQPTTITAILNHFAPEHPHIEFARDPKNAEAYCRKGDTRVSGPITNIPAESVGQGSRSDLARVADRVLAGEDISSIAVKHPTTFIRYHRGEFRF